jgi:hypothetical protein
MFLSNPIESTVGMQAPPSPFIYFESSRWNITNAVSNPKQMRMGLLGNTTEYDHVTSSKFVIENFASGVWYSLFEITNSSFYLDTKLEIKSPIGNGYGGQIVFDYQGNIKLNNLAGVASGVYVSRIGASPAAFPVFTCNPANPYTPEIRSYLGAAIRFRQGYCGWEGTYSEGANGSTSAFVTIENNMKLRIGDYAAPTAYLEVIRDGEQIRLGFSDAIYMSITVADDGIVTFAGASITDFKFMQNIMMANAKNFVFDTATGTKIGTSATQKLALWGGTPIDRPAAFNVVVDGTGGTSSGVVDDCNKGGADAPTINDNFATIVAELDALKNWVENIGGSTARI